MGLILTAKNLDSVESFSSAIPSTIDANLEFRDVLHRLCAKDKAVRDRVIQFCKEYPIVAWQILFWTYNPKNKGKERNLPFLPWDVQKDGILTILNAVNTGEDLLIDKSRDMGCTWMVLSCFLWLLLFEPDTQLLIASRKEEYVDRRGDHKALFSKLLYMLKRLPDWAKPPFEKTHMHIRNPWNESAIDGESTNADLGAGDRRTAVMLDEFARVDPPNAASISETLSDTSDCIIYSSTHTSRGHPYAKLRYSGRVKVFVLPWWKRPERAAGLYTSTDYGMVKIHDLNYYHEKYPSLFMGIKTGDIIEVKEYEMQAMLDGVERSLFVADGSGKWRSPWYDNQCRRRSARDVAQNLDMDPVGSGDMVFDSSVLQRMRTDYVCKPRYEGEVDYEVEVASRVSDDIHDDIVKIEFLHNSGKKRFKWWGELKPNKRPPQDRDYVIGCDISLGSGTSNSVASIYDCKTNSKVGSWVCSFTSPTHFAEQVVALGYWCGGRSHGKAYLIWEANGAGQTFARRVHDLGYRYYYKRRDEQKPHRPRTSQPGWHSSASTKMDLITRYRESLHLSFRLDDQDRRFINPDESSIAEAEDYVFLSASQLGPSSAQEDDAGAKATHGDRVIGDALCCLGREDIWRGEDSTPAIVPPGSYLARRQERERQLNGEDQRWLN